MRIGRCNFDDDSRMHYMGILNVTPDSFYDHGKYFDISRAVEHALSMINEGAEIIDIGGESTRPGHTLISDEEELNRVIPVLKELRKRTGAVISIDTTKVSVAREAIACGADMINDVSGLLSDEGMAGLIAQTGVSCCIMNPGRSEGYSSVCSEVQKELKALAKRAEEYGIKRECIILDPGIGFGKSKSEDLAILNDLKSTVVEGYPMLLACSNKSVFGYAYGLAADERTEATCKATVDAYKSGYSFVRVHDVAANVSYLEKILREEKESGYNKG